MFKVWMPMHDGTLTNQGLSDISITNNGSTVDNNGKIGKCYSFDGSSKYISITNPLTDASEVSCAVWVKPLTNTNTNEQIINIGTSSGWGNIRFGILQRSVNQFVFHVSDGTNTISYSCVSGTIPVNQWIHIACTYKDKTLKMYLNGELVKTYTISFTPSFSGVTKIGIGAAPNGAEKFTGYINDVRIWENHCLSPLEVKKIAQGLVLHYRLSGIGGENLASKYIAAGNNTTSPSTTANNGCTVYSGDYSIQIPAIKNNDTYFTIWLTEKPVNGEVYTLSANVSGLLSGSYYNFPLFALNNSAMGIWKINHNGICSLTFTMTYTGTINTATVNGQTLYRMFMDDISRSIASGQGAIIIKNIKLEHGDHPTPWCPATSDPKYSIMGLDDNIEYDCSGFGNNGTKTSGITWSNDSPRYTGSYQFNGTNSYLKVTDSNWMAQYVEEMTVNVWAYADDWTKQTKLFSCTESGGFNTEAGASGYIRFPRHVATNAGHTTHAYQYNNNGIKLADLDSGWHMFTFIYNTSGEKIYIDGQLYSQGSYTSYGLHFNTSARLFLGCEASGANPSSPYFGGKESDFRIYYTALSADDVLDLYHLGGSIDSNGVFHTYEYVEGE